MNKNDDLGSRKDFRRKKLQNKNLHKHSNNEDDFEARSNKKKEIKKIKEDFENEEWEDWDRYYNH